MSEFGLNRTHAELLTSSSIETGGDRSVDDNKTRNVPARRGSFGAALNQDLPGVADENAVRTSMHMITYS